MPDFRYDDPEPRIYHDYGLLQQGDQITADDPPDHRFTAASVTPQLGASASNSTSGS